MKHTLQADSIFFEVSGRNILKGGWMMAETGSIVALFGRNGCGKSSLLNVIYGSLTAESGTTRIDGQYLKVPYQHPHLLRYLPAYSFTPPGLTVRRVLADYGITQALLLREFPEFTDRLQQRVGSFSSGERRLLEILLVVMSNSAFVMLDEPFLYLSPIHAEKVLQLIQSRKAQTGFIITDHQYELLFPAADTKMVLVNGQMSVVHTPADLEASGYIKL
ncbi:ATP-binding cassette domain-containing protein [Chitinophaga horti]|uniref:ATP-binding cassette domain-containing protein n=1 Tax=Chitinophaga horti TaxID=2920382 RepID=A0ABY6J5V7_9BACT|nr:ATP-binding cassette domain-containing protein [Chitinophaga horti]UYQ93632.1 ATP-binding cassette domain-containing protein [Chitinophaga horti]